MPIFLPRERRNNDIQRERKENEDQRVQPPFQNNLLNEEEEVEELEYEDLDQSTNHLEEESDEIFLHKDQYQNDEFFDDFYTFFS